MKNILDHNLVLLLTIAEFISTTPEERIEKQHQNGVIKLIAKFLEEVKQVEGISEIGGIMAEAGFVDPAGKLTSRGQSRALSALRSTMRPDYRNISYEDMLSQQAFKGLLLLVGQATSLLKSKVDSFESFTPSDNVKALLEAAGDSCYSVAGIDLIDDVPENDEK